MSNARMTHRYSEELKRCIVQEIESGQMSVRDASKSTQAGVGQVQKWLDEYGRFKPKRDVVEVVMKSEKDKIAELEKALAEAHLKIRVYDELIAQASKRYKTDLKKSIGIPLLKGSAEVATEMKLERSAKSLAELETLTTKGESGVGESRGRRRS